MELDVLSLDEIDLYSSLGFIDDVVSSKFNIVGIINFGVPMLKFVTNLVFKFSLINRFLSYEDDSMFGNCSKGIKIVLFFDKLNNLKNVNNNKNFTYLKFQHRKKNRYIIICITCVPI